MKLFSMRANILVNMIGMALIMILTFFATPYYLKYLGPEAFGLIGFFYLFSMCISVFDFGVSPFLQREIAKSTDGNSLYQNLNNVIQIVTIYFILILLFINILSLPLSGFVANSWLTSDAWDLLSLDEVKKSIRLIFLTSSLLMVINLFKCGLTGYQLHYWLNMLLTLTSILRYVGSIVLISSFNGSIIDFFIYQVLIALIEVIALSIKFYSQVPNNLLSFGNLSIGLFKKIIIETSKISTISILTIVTYQLDKIFLSKALPLQEYGYFSLIVMICSGLIVISVPIKRAIQPRISILFLSKNINDSIELYRKASHLITIIIGATVITICMYSVQIILFWTNDLTASLWVANRLYLFVIGAGLLAIQAILLALQEARGDLTLQIKLNFIFLMIQIPLMLFCVLFFGITFKAPVIGIGLAWLGVRVTSFVVSTFLIHKTYDVNLNRIWFLKDFLPVILFQTLVAFLIYPVMSNEVISSLNNPIIVIIFAGFILVSSGIFSSHYFHRYVKKHIKR